VKESRQRLEAAKQPPTAPTTTDAEPADKAEQKGSESDSDDNKEAKAKPADKDEPKKEEPKLYTSDELSSFEDLRRVDMDRVPPELRKTVAKMQKAEADKHAKLNAKIRAAEATAPRKDEQSTTADTESDDDIVDLLDDPKTAAQGVKKFLAHPAAKEALKEFIREEFGLTPEVLETAKTSAEARVAREGIVAATEKFPELKDDAFYDRVVRSIGADEEDAEELDSTKSPKVVTRILMAHAAIVKREVDAEKEADTKRKTKEREDKETKERLKKETSNAQSQSKSIEAPRKSAAPPSDGKMSALDYIKKRKAESNYTTL
jgi:hypothetical protein